MTNDRMALQALLAKTPDANYLREMIGFAAQRLMELDVESRTGAGHGEPSAERLAQRNGYRDRAGMFSLNVKTYCSVPLSSGNRGANPALCSAAHRCGVT